MLSSFLDFLFKVHANIFWKYGYNAIDGSIRLLAATLSFNIFSVLLFFTDVKSIPTTFFILVLALLFFFTDWTLGRRYLQKGDKGKGKGYGIIDKIKSFNYGHISLSILHLLGSFVLFIVAITS